MPIITLLNQCYRFPGFVYHHVRFAQDRRSLQVRIRPRAGSRAICSGCHRQAPRLRPPLGSAVRVHSYLGYLGVPGLSPLPHAPGRLQSLWRHRRGSALGRRQTPTDQGLHAVSGTLGAQTFRDPMRAAIRFEVLTSALWHISDHMAIGQVRAHERGRAPGQPLAAEHNVACRKNPIPFW
jgi:hypothetical protein